MQIDEVEYTRQYVIHTILEHDQNQMSRDRIVKLLKASFEQAKVEWPKFLEFGQKLKDKREGKISFSIKAGGAG